MRKWAKEHIFAVGIILTIAVETCCFIVNAGRAWWGDPAHIHELLMTILYILFWVAFTMVSLKYTQLRKIVFVISLLTFISSVCSLIFSLTGGFIIEALLSIFVSVPFYGLRFFMGWTELYVIAVVLSIIWLICTGRNMRKIQKSKRIK